MTTRSRKPAPATASTPRVAVVAAGAVVACGLALAAWWWFGRDDRLASTLALQQKLLAEELAGRERRLAVDRIIRNVDTMRRDQVQQLRAALAAVARQMEQQSIDAFFAAPAAEKPALLDRDLERWELLRELRLAVGNNSWGRKTKTKTKTEKQPEPPADPPLTPEEKELARLRRDLARKYRAALEQRARQRGVSLRM